MKSEDLDAEKPEETPAEKPKAKKPEKPVARKADAEIKLVHPSIKHGKSIASVRVFKDTGDWRKTDYDDHEIEIVDGVLTIENIDKNLPIRDQLVKEGWTDKTDYGLNPVEPVEAPYVPKVVKWKFLHPDNSPQEPFNCISGVHYGQGKDMVELLIDVQNGYVTTEDFRVAECLVKAKWILVETEKE